MTMLMSWCWNFVCRSDSNGNWYDHKLIKLNVSSNSKCKTCPGWQCLSLDAEILYVDMIPMVIDMNIKWLNWMLW